MSGNRILWGQITLVLAVVLATTWTATQWTAWRLGFQPQLGQPWFELAPGMPVYYPPAFFWWWYAYDAYAPPIFVEGAFIAASGGFIAIAVAIALSILRAREAKNVETYGSARWASNEEIHSAGLLGPDGAFLDAPVAGSRPQAEAGQLIYFVGGEATIFARAEPILKAMGGAVHHAGAVGSGAGVKLMVGSASSTWKAGQRSSAANLGLCCLHQCAQGPLDLRGSRAGL